MIKKTIGTIAIAFIVIVIITIVLTLVNQLAIPAFQQINGEIKWYEAFLVYTALTLFIGFVIVLVCIIPFGILMMVSIYFFGCEHEWIEIDKETTVCRKCKKLKTKEDESNCPCYGDI